jgi:AcrR family transcriptional regulator
MTAGKRKIGRPANISRDSIVRAALDLDSEGRSLSMQAVADRLGVRRSALYHYVTDRDELIAVVAIARLDEVIDEEWMPGQDADWRTWLTAYAQMAREALLSNTRLPDYLLISGPAGLRQLAQIERVCAVMVRDGFTATDAGRCLTLLGELVQINARAVFVRRELGEEPHRTSVSETLKAHPDEFPTMRAAGAHPWDPDDQFAFDLDNALAGMGVLLSTTPPAR